MSGCHSLYTLGNVAFNTANQAWENMPGVMCQCPCHFNGKVPLGPDNCWCKCNQISSVEQPVKHLEIVPRRTPHTCPVCNGEGVRASKEQTETVFCKPCEGKGIVWG
jgi:hypothetical protein